MTKTFELKFLFPVISSVTFWARFHQIKYICGNYKTM